jgi:Zn-dependent peptidase ImmA (M78 family)
MGVEVRFVDLPSLEGMYADTPRPVILIGAQRPAARKAYTCAHELGHHVFSHGTTADELRPEETPPYRLSPEDFLAQSFAGFLLMPKLAIDNAFYRRSWDVTRPTPEQVYRIAGYFGVGYTTVVNHMSWSLGQLPDDTATALRKKRLRDIRQTIAECRVPYSLTAVDQFWEGLAVDVEVGDLLSVPRKIQEEGLCLRHKGQNSNGELYEACSPGRGKLYSDSTSWACYVRVSRREYVGRSIYRHLEEAEDDPNI